MSPRPQIALKSFTGEQTRTFSHKDVLFPTNKSMASSISRPGGPPSLSLCDEWEKKILTTQGKLPNREGGPKLLGHHEAFVLDETSSPINGKKFTWEVEALRRREETRKTKSAFLNGYSPVARSNANGRAESGKGHLFVKSPHVSVPPLKLNA